MATLTDNQYEALLKLAAVAYGGDDPVFLKLRSDIDRANGLTRYVLVIRYEVLPQVVINGLSHTPKGETIRLEQTRPPTREDVDTALQGVRYHPSLVWITADPRGEVGYHELDNFPWG